MSRWPFRVDCIRAGCGHSSDVHSLDDALNVDPCDPQARFRCRWCACPDMVRSEGNLAALEKESQP